MKVAGHLSVFCHHISMSYLDRVDLLSGHICSHKHLNDDPCDHEGDPWGNRWQGLWQFHVYGLLDVLHDSTLHTEITTSIVKIAGCFLSGIRSADHLLDSFRIIVSRLLS